MSGVRDSRNPSDLTRHFGGTFYPILMFTSQKWFLMKSEQAEANLRKALENLINDFEVLEMTEEVIELADTYLSHRRLPRGDALHLASASIGEMDFLVTWNLRHIYKRGTQEMIREVNTRLRIPVPTIVTPEDFFGEEE